MIEVWRDVVGYEGRYQVSDLGRIRSYVSNSPGRLRCPTVGKWGYPMISLRKDGKSATRMVHHLVCEAFHGPRPPGHLACHRNDVRTDNRAGNLHWGTKADNAIDAVKNARIPVGEKSSLAKISTENVRDIRRRLAAGARQVAIAKEYGLDPSSVSRIATGDNWKHVE